MQLTSVLKRPLLRRQFSTFVKVVEVGPRDGLQNEKQVINIQDKLKLINDLSETGLKVIEAGSFVSPKWIPQMADTSALFPKINALPHISYPCLVPNSKGFQNALKVGVKEIAIFTAASETFCKKNINCSIEESFGRFDEIFVMARENNIKVRGYVSTVVGCPYEGPTIKPETVSMITKRLLDMGCYEVSLGDTVGVGTPGSVRPMLECVLNENPVEKIAMHCHDTYGQAIGNIVASLDCGIRIFDSSVSGLGGCPYAKGASGNVATEDLIYLLSGMGFETGVDLEKIMDISLFISNTLGRSPGSKVTLAKRA